MTQTEFADYALVLERLMPLDVHKHKRQRRVINSFRSWSAGGRIPESSDLELICGEDKKCQRFGQQMIDGLKKLDQLNIGVTDFHAGNVGIDKHGRYKFLDLGEGWDDRLALKLPTLSRVPSQKRRK
jgi:hypothetical protein